MSRRGLMLVVCALSVGCAGPRWTASALLLDADAVIAEALGDPRPGERFDPKLVPTIAAPTSLRPCCAFGMDQRMRYIGIPIYSMSTVTEPAALGPHEYDNGTISLSSNGRLLGLERDGIIFTCRGGFIDTSHVRDNADMAFFLATRLLAALPGPLALDFSTMDADVRVRVEVPAALVSKYGPYQAAAAVAEWLAYQHGAWHEIAQWWGYQAVRGYSETVSAFSSEDFYSNALGARLGALAIENRIFRTREDYNAGIDALLGAALRQLGATPLATAREAMAAVDRVWWDKRYDLPDNRAVPKRSFQIESPVVPWLLDDAGLTQRIPPSVAAQCANQPRRELSYRTQLGFVPISSFAAIEWRPKTWVTESFPFAKPGQQWVSATEVDRLVEATHAAMTPVFAPGFDKPRAVCQRDELQAALARLGSGSGGRMGVAAQVIGRSDQVSLRSGEGFPMPSAVELAAAIAALAAIDSGELSAIQVITLPRPGDAASQSALYDAAPRAGSVRLDTLIDAVLAGGDALATALLIDVVGAHRLEVLFRSAGFGDGASVTGTATPEATLQLLTLLVDSDALSAASRAHVLRRLRANQAGAKRLKAGVPVEAELAHMSATSATTAGLTHATSDLGLMTLPGGRLVAVVVSVADSTSPEAEREASIAAAARAVWDCWQHVQ